MRQATNPEAPGGRKYHVAVIGADSGDTGDQRPASQGGVLAPGTVPLASTHGTESTDVALSPRPDAPQQRLEVAAPPRSASRSTPGLWQLLDAAALWARVRWTLSTTAVAASSFFLGLVAIWAAAWMSHHSVAQTTVQWDGTWYYFISQHGYVHALPTAANQYNALRAAFFPGLPFVERVVHDIVGGSPARTTLLVGGVGLVVSCLLLRVLVARMFGDEVAWRSVVVFAFFPGAYVFLLGYSEALEIPLAILVLYALRRRWYLVAGVATAVATGTRLTAVALVAACVVGAVREVAAQHAAIVRTRATVFRLVTAIAAPIIGLGGLVAYMVFLHQRTGSYLAFNTAERVGWHNSLDFAEPFRAIQAFADNPFSIPYQTMNALGTVAILACLALLGIDGLRRLRLEETIYAAIILLAWMFTSNTGAWFRFAESAFPVLILLALRLGQRWYPVVACAGATILGILLMFFLMNTAFSP